MDRERSFIFIPRGMSQSQRENKKMGNFQLEKRQRDSPGNIPSFGPFCRIPNAKVNNLRRAKYAKDKKTSLYSPRLLLFLLPFQLHLQAQSTRVPWRLRYCSGDLTEDFTFNKVIIEMSTFQSHPKWRYFG